MNKGRGFTVSNTISGYVAGPALQIGVNNVPIVISASSYRLRSWANTDQRPTSMASQLGPSYLLDARRGVVPFADRPEMLKLTAWANSSRNSASVLLVCGRGGVGKSRLTSQFASSAMQAGWDVYEAEEAQGNYDIAGAAGLTAMTSIRAPMLVIIDYADRWEQRVLTGLINMLLERPAHTRIILLARSCQSFWKHIRKEIPPTAGLTPPLEIGDFASTVRDRLAAIRTAVEAFARQLGVPVNTVDYDAAGRMVEQIPSPTALDLHMAALAAVCASFDGVDYPDPGDLSRYLLDHERRTWGADTDDEMEMSVVLATLFGPTSGSASAREILRAASLGDGDAELERMISDHEKVYPQLAGASVERAPLQPLRPDRLGEDFVGDALAAAKTRERVHEAFASAVMQHSLAVHRALTVLGAAGERHDGAWSMLVKLFTSRHELVRGAPALVLNQIVERADSELASDLLAALPRYTDVRSEGAAALAARLADEDAHTGDLIKRINSTFEAAARFRAAGKLDLAVRYQMEAVSLARALASRDQGAMVLVFAEALQILATLIWENGETDSAIEPASEAVFHFRNIQAALVPTDGEAEGREITESTARSLWTLGILLAESGYDVDQGLSLTTEAVALLRAIPEATTESIDGLAIALNNLGARLSEQDKHAEALSAYSECVTLTRTLCATDRDFYVERLAGSLTNQASGFLFHGRNDEALGVAAEACCIRREALEILPTMHRRRDLARALQVLARCYWATGEMDAALRYYDESAEAFAALDNLSDAGRRELRLFTKESEAARSGADFLLPVSARSRWSVSPPEATEASTATQALRSMLAELDSAIHAAKSGNPSEAQLTLEAVDYEIEHRGVAPTLELDMRRLAAYVELADASGEANEEHLTASARERAIDLCRSHFNVWEPVVVIFCRIASQHASYLERSGQMRRALALLEESSEVSARLTSSEDPLHRFAGMRSLRDTLWFRAELHQRFRSEDTLSSFEEAIVWSRKMLQRDRNLGDRHVSLQVHMRGVLNFATALEDAGANWSSVAVSYEAVKCGYELAGAINGEGRYLLARALAAHSGYILAADRLSVARSVAEEAVANLQSSSDVPRGELYLAAKGDAYISLGRVLGADGRRMAAVRAFERAAESRRALLDLLRSREVIESLITIYLEIDAHLRIASVPTKEARTNFAQLISTVDNHMPLIRDDFRKWLIPRVSSAYGLYGASTDLNIERSLDLLAG